MILRLWSGWAEGADANRYENLLNQEIAPGIVDRRIAGLRSFDVWSRLPAGQDNNQEFLTAMTFADLTAVEEFTGGNSSASVVPPAARRLLSSFDHHSRHYQLSQWHDVQLPRS